MDWEGVKKDLRDAGYAGFEFDSGKTAVPGLSGEWLSGKIARERKLKREKQSLLIRICDYLPSSAAVNANPENAPESIQNIAERHGLNVVIVSVSNDKVRIALCDPSEHDL
ncbi:hypothetical protein [Natrinema soli]|uniref:tRNA nuclease CdiA C-terminal domain-containing protein n=1 Tax=Natrinema soli TaxID=1930624 RepID=A0ABD5SVR6_9EURY|nr:hypothetical protein [Natrinema soli]